MSNELHGLTRDELKLIVKEAVRDVVREDLELVGIDMSDAATRLEVRKDMETLRRVREMLDASAKRIGGTVLILMIAGALALVGVGIKAKIAS